MSIRTTGVIALAALFASAGCASKGGSDADGVWAAETFARIRGLAGTWSATETSMLKDPVRYHVIGNGSAVLETLFPGTPHEMATVYHMDGGALVATHYCAAGNQPRYRAEPTSDPNQVRWAFVSLSNGDPSKDMHMHEGLTTFAASDRLHQQWQGWSEGRADPEHLAVIDLVRSN